MSSHRGLVSTVGSASGNLGLQPGSGLEIEFAQLSDPGRVRDHNEDYLGYYAPPTAAQARSHGWMFAVADGVGGHDRGEVASRVAIETVTAGFPSAAAGEPPASLLERLVQSANLQVYETGLGASPGGMSMATTIVACTLRYDRAAVAHVGDSRCYLVRRGQASLLTRDHTMVNDQVRLGILSAKEAASSERRHLLSRSLGSEMFVGVEISELQVYADDVLILCSDGMHGSVEDTDFVRALAHVSDLNRVAASLVDLAKERDGSDNISVQIIRVRAVERVGMYRGRPYKLR